MHFVVFGQTRTGSSLLMDTLQAHPQVQCDVNSGEILHSNHWRRGVKLCLRPLPRRFPELYVLWKAVRSARPVYGFKLLHHQTAAPGRLLAGLHRCGWLVIHVQRRRLFDLALSQQVAQSTGHYGDYRLIKQPDHMTIDIPPDSFLRQMRQCIDIRRSELRSLTGIAHVSVVYEGDLLAEADRNRICRAIVEALHLERYPIITPRSRSWNRPYHEIVANYARLVATAQTDEGLALRAEWDSLFEAE